MSPSGTETYIGSWFFQKNFAIFLKHNLNLSDEELSCDTARPEGRAQRLSVSEKDAREKCYGNGRSPDRHREEKEGTTSENRQGRRRPLYMAQLVDQADRLHFSYGLYVLHSATAPRSDTKETDTLLLRDHRQRKMEPASESTKSLLGTGLFAVGVRRGRSLILLK